MSRGWGRLGLDAGLWGESRTDGRRCDAAWKGGIEDVVDGGWETESMHTCTLGWLGIGLCPERSKS